MMGAKGVASKGSSALEVLKGLKKSLVKDLALAKPVGGASQEVNWNAVKAAKEFQGQQRFDVEKYRALLRRY